MAIFIQKLNASRGQSRVTLPKLLLQQAGLEHERVVEMWATEESIIHIGRYHGQKDNSERVSRRTAKSHR